VFWFAVVVAAIVAIVLTVRFLRLPANRARAVAFMDSLPLLRGLVAIGRRVRPQARFLWARLTPGGLGLELTSLLAALAVALYVLVAYAVILSADAGPTPGDGAALDLARDLQGTWLTGLSEIVSGLGSGAVVLPLAALAALALAWQRAWAELAVLVAAMAIIVIAVPEIKEAIDRPRPPDPLVFAASEAYPSGHAAYSTLYAWLALTVTIRMRPGITGGTAVIVAGIALAGLVGLSRVYLRVHYLSDVSGGWALGVSAFAACAALVLLVVRLRQNAGRDGAPRDDSP
jgi:undecaprenyl-diphosphatase